MLVELTAVIAEPIAATSEIVTYSPAGSEVLVTLALLSVVLVATQISWMS